ncbi:DUF2157 domain-containing protein [Aquibacillus albus]|uniref:Membrane protein n=1 Tax=Aquibacillus albus TaxID=1168171 RepID=A0ABS2N0R5_9BACI|nr:DUF2157 domain-containing protein [Aquibacillus albus]MBM7571500.1 putative membrane protein [Aquibacillus albus]
MRRKRLQKETREWVNEGIISSEQEAMILNRYLNKNRHFLLIIFASLFIGLGFLTFIASNWSFIPAYGKMAIILCSMLAFYLSGEYVYRKKSTMVGMSLIIIGLLIFGAGIFLTGQMYHYTYAQATPFVIWSLASFFLFVAYQHAPIFVVAIVITTVGQLYSAFTFHSFNVWLCFLLLLAFGHYTYHQARYLYSYLFAASFVIQSLVFIGVERSEYYWLLIFMFLLYIIGDVSKKVVIHEAFRAVSLLSLFVLAIVHVFILGEDFFFYEDREFNLFFMIVWSLLFVAFITLKVAFKQYNHLTELALFLPVFYIAFGDMVAMLCLFIFSLGLLINGYQEENNNLIMFGTGAFLISTLIAYVHIAWAFLDKSLFFFIGGIILFAFSYFLERKRRMVRKSKGGAGK